MWNPGVCHHDWVTGSLPTNQPHEPAPENGADDAGIAGSVTGEWVEVFQPDGAPEPPAPPQEPAAGRNGVVSLLLFVTALLLVIVGSVTPLFTAAIWLYNQGLADPATNPGPAH